MSTSYDSLDRETLQAEIQVAIAAGRELDPALDEHLAHTAMERYFAGRPKTPRVVEPSAPRLTADDITLRGIAVLFSGGMIVALIVAHAWEMSWLIIPIMVLLMVIFSRRQRNPKVHYLDSNPAREHDDQRRFKDAHLHYKMEMLADKRALLHGLIKGFSGPDRGR
mgnify:CR=1 FL=1